MSQPVVSEEQLFQRATEAAVTAIAKKADFAQVEGRAVQQLASVTQAYIRQLGHFAMQNANGG